MKQHRLVASRWRSVPILALSLALVASCADDADDEPTADEADAGEADEASTDEGADEAEGQEISLTVGAENEAVLPYSQLLESYFVPELERRVAEETPHTVDVTEAYGTITGPGEMLSALETGLVDIGGHTCFCINPAELYPYMLPFHVPFSSPDPATAQEAFNTVLDEVPEMLEVYEGNHNQRVLAVYGSSDYGLLTTFPVTSVEDLQGHSLSAVGPNLDWIPAEAFDVTVVQGTLAEWYTGLQTGLYDGVIIHAEGAGGFNLEEVTDYYTVGGFGAMTWGSLNVNLDTWNSLPSDVQEIVAELSAEFEAQYPDAIVEASDAALDAMEEAGVEITEFDESVRVDWAEALPELPRTNMEEAESRGFTFAPEAYQTYIRAQEELGYEFPRAWELDD